MKANMSNLDRMIRVIIAIVIFVLFATGNIAGTLGYVLVGFGVVFVLTSLVSFCPLYTLVGLSTKKQ
jgi:Protein of unknown function (DUF2892)